MSWHLEFRPEVEEDVAEAAGWYESRDAGLGREFVDEMIQGVASHRPTSPDRFQAASCHSISAGGIPRDFRIESSIASMKGTNPFS